MTALANFTPRGSAAERKVAMTSTTLTPAGTYLGEQADGPLAGWPLVADGQGGTLVASPTGTCWNRGYVDPSTLDATGCWAAVDAFYASDLYKVFRAGYDEKRRIERAATLAALRAERAA